VASAHPWFSTFATILGPRRLVLASPMVLDRPPSLVNKSGSDNHGPVPRYLAAPGAVNNGTVIQLSGGGVNKSPNKPT
jgi:hypothetical protein